MPDQETLKRARKDVAEGKSPSTQAGEFVREEMHHIREGKHGARSPLQAIAIGLSKARRAGVKLPAPPEGRVSEDVRHEAESDFRKGQSASEPSVSNVRSRAIRKALARERRTSASPHELAQQARRVARKRSATERRAAGKKAALTKGKAGQKTAAKKAARTRERAA